MPVVSLQKRSSKRSCNSFAGGHSCQAGSERSKAPPSPAKCNGYVFTFVYLIYSFNLIYCVMYFISVYFFHLMCTFHIRQFGGSAIFGAWFFSCEEFHIASGLCCVCPTKISSWPRVKRWWLQSPRPVIQAAGEQTTRKGPNGWVVDWGDGPIWPKIKQSQSHCQIH